MIFTLRRSRGAIGSYLAAPGAPLAAARVPRRPMDGADGIPGVGKGLTVGPLSLNSMIARGRSVG